LTNGQRWIGFSFTLPPIHCRTQRLNYDIPKNLW